MNFSSILENWDEWDGTEGPSQENNNQDELHCEDPGFIVSKLKNLRMTLKLIL